jgi:RNA polymerase sigma-70 factor (ECF subfamily)
MIYQAAIEREFPVAEPSELTRLRSGDPAAMAAVVARYQHRLYRYFLRLVHEPATADDLFQQTWLQVVRHLGRYDASRSFDTWLFAIAHNAAMDLLRRKPGESLDDGEHTLRSTAPDALAMVLAGERTAIVAAALRGLPPLYREVLTLRFEEGMKLEEIAEVTGAPLSTIKSRVHRGLETLKEKLGRKGIL